MFDKLASLAIVIALVCTLGGSSAFANNLDKRTDTAKGSSGAAAEKEVKANEQLKNSLLKLVADAKAGKVAPAAKSQLQPAQSSHWSKGTKIAVGVGIVVAVIAVIVIVKANDSPGRVF